MADKATSSKLAVRTYPALQDLRDKLDQLIAEKQYKQLENTLCRPRSTISSEVRKTLFDKQAHPMTDVINELYRQAEPTEDTLSPEVRMMLHSVAGYAPYFASILLPCFYEDSLLQMLANSRQSTETLYSYFVKFVSENADQYQFLHKSLQDITREKAKVRQLLKTIYASRPWEHVFVHRVEASIATRGQKRVNHRKHVVIDAEHPELFDPEKYFQLSLKKSYIIEPNTPEIEYHIMVLDGPCPYNNDELREMVTGGEFKNHHGKPWFVGAIIFNLYAAITNFKDFVDLSRLKLLQNADARRPVKRSPLRQGVTIDPRTKLVAVGDMADQNGYLRTPKNMENISKKVLSRMEHISQEGTVNARRRKAKVKLMRDSDSVLDTFVKVVEILLPGVVEDWKNDTSVHHAISSGLRLTTLSAYVGCNYSEFIHLDGDDHGPTVGLRASHENPRAPKAHMFVYPGMKCKGKNAIIIRQPIGTVTLWKASKFEHTSSIDERAHLQSLYGASGTLDDAFCNDPLSVGLVVVQKPKLLSLPSNRHDVISQLYSIPVLEAFLSKKSESGQHSQVRRKEAERMRHREKLEERCRNFTSREVQKTRKYKKYKNKSWKSRWNYSLEYKNKRHKPSSSSFRPGLGTSGLV